MADSGNGDSGGSTDSGSTDTSTADFSSTDVSFNDNNFGSGTDVFGDTNRSGDNYSGGISTGDIAASSGYGAASLTEFSPASYGGGTDVFGSHADKTGVNYGFTDFSGSSDSIDHVLADSAAHYGVFQQYGQTVVDPYSGKDVKFAPVVAPVGKWAYDPVNHAKLDAAATQIANDNGIPVNFFKAVIYTESGWNPFAVSPTGAMGIGQMFPGAMAETGVANPFDPIQGLQGAAKYLVQQKQALITMV
jgi:hypothetical protein